MTKQESVFFSIVIPVYGSEPILGMLYQRLIAVMEAMEKPFEIIFVEDSGPDGAWPVLRDLAKSDKRVRAIQLMSNSGQGAATYCGFSHASGQFIITMDDDLQHPPEEIPAMWDAIRNQESVDVIMGVPKKKQHNFIRRLGSRFVHRVNCIFLGKDPNLQFTSFRIMRRPLVLGMLELKTLYPALGPMINSVTQRITNIIVEHAPRYEGRSGYSMVKIMKQTMGNFIGYSMLPLRLLAIFGAVGIVVSIFLAVTLLVRYFLGGINVPGWASLALLLIILSGFNFFAFAVLGEYVIRILQRSNHTPQYIIREVVGIEHLP